MPRSMARILAATHLLASGLGLSPNGGRMMQHRRGPVALEAKAKKGGGKGGAAAAALEALEMLDKLEEKQAPAEPIVVVDDAPKQQQKGGKAAAAAAALAALDAFDEVPAVEAAVEEQEEVQVKKGGKAAAAAAALADLDDDDDFDEDGMPKKKKKQKKEKKNKKEQVEEQVEEVEEEQEEEEAEQGEEGGEGITLEQRKKRERGSAKIRVIERESKAGIASMRMEKVSVIFKNAEVLSDASWSVMTGDRVGVVGANGGGKTTMLKILAGELEPTTGEVGLSKAKLRVAYLRQEFSESLDLTRTLRKELQSVFTRENDALEALGVAEKKIEGGDTTPAALEALAEAQEGVSKANAYQVEAKAEKVAVQMGFGDDDLEALVGSFSGGWKMRIGLAKVLLESPDVLLLDEPTNHLDLESVYWLEDFLRAQSIAMVLVSHDREFVDQVCTKIVDVDEGITYSYDDCNYSKFIRRKAANRKAWEAAFKKQQSKVSEEKKFINKNRAGARAAQAQSREKGLEKLLKSPDFIKKPPSPRRGLRFRFPEPPRCGLEILNCEKVGHTYGDRRLFRDVSFELRKGDRVAILGANGVGKSTLLRLASGLEEPTQGKIGAGSANVVSAYFAQNQADALDLSKTVLRTIEDASLQGGAERSYETLRALLGQFLFKGDDVQKQVESLSGGEKARVALCTMMLGSNNVLFLDEPTNHLDIPAKEMLEDALVNFDGTMLVVSHDRYFISKVANTIITLEQDGTMSRHDGDYASYMLKREELQEKVERRYVDGVVGIEAAKERDPEVIPATKKTFGGSLHGGSGRKDKGIKNAKRMS